MNDMNVTQDNMTTEQVNVIWNDQRILIPHTFSNIGQIILFWNTNKVKIDNKNIWNLIPQIESNVFTELKNYKSISLAIINY